MIASKERNIEIGFVDANMHRQGSSVPYSIVLVTLDFILMLETETKNFHKKQCCNYFGSG